MTIRKPTERDVLKACLELLKWKGIFHFRNNSGALKVADRLVRFGQAGSPDVLALLPGGRLLAIEVKSASGRLRPAQEAWLAEARRHGAATLVVRSASELQAGLDELLKEAAR